MGKKSDLLYISFMFFSTRRKRSSCNHLMELPPVVRLKGAHEQERARKVVALGHLTRFTGFDWLYRFHSAEPRRGGSRDSICCCWLSEAC